MRPFVHLLLSGVFERFPKLKFVITEGSAAGVAAIVKQLDPIIENVRKGEIGELKYTADNALPRSASEYFARQCWVGASFPSIPDAEVRKIMGADRFMWGSDYPHDEGTQPFSREHLRQVMGHLEPEQIQQIVGTNTAELYGFDMEALRPAAEKYGPTVAEIATPLEELPEGANEALRRSAKALAKAR
jgi:predicted TIM-barrel fold metal-dependent hydrolase